MTKPHNQKPPNPKPKTPRKARKPKVMTGLAAQMAIIDAICKAIERDK